MRKAQQGFTLIELMIVIAIIAIIAAIAIPNLLESKKLSNERSVTATLKQLHTTQQLFKEKLEVDNDNGDGTGDKDGEYAIDFDELSTGPTSGKMLLNMIPLADLTTSEKNGYLYKLWSASADGGLGVNGDESSWACGAMPKTYDKTGNQVFAITEEGITYSHLNDVAKNDSTDPLVIGDLFGANFDNSTIGAGGVAFEPIK